MLARIDNIELFYTTLGSRPAVVWKSSVAAK